MPRGDRYTHSDYPVGVICALAMEKAAFVAMLDEIHEPLPTDKSDSNSYTFGRIGEHNVVAVYRHGMHFFGDRLRVVTSCPDTESPITRRPVLLLLTLPMSIYTHTTYCRIHSGNPPASLFYLQRPRAGRLSLVLVFMLSSPLQCATDQSDADFTPHAGASPTQHHEHLHICRYRSDMLAVTKLTFKWFLDHIR